MRAKRSLKSVVSVLLAVTIVLSACIAGLASVSAASLALSYSFMYENPGYAQGVVKLTGGSSDYGSYYLYWADDTKALDGYSEITKLNLNKEYKNFIFDEFTVIPPGASKLIAIKSETEPADKSVASASAVFEIPESKQFKYTEADVVYNFQALSDIHIHKQEPPYYTYSELHFAQALEVAADRDAEFVTICGDMINGYDSLYVKEWQAYQQVIANSSFCNPIYETNGNHEAKSDSSNKAATEPYKYGLESYKNATGLNTATGAMQKEPYYEITAPNGDHFIFMALELSTSPNESDEFTTQQMSWLKGLLKKYNGDGKNIFIYEHAFFSGYGAGDNKELPLYAGSLQDSYPVVRELKSLLEQYPDVFFMSGHSHIDFKYGYNFDNEGGTTAYTVHIPATTSTTKVVNGGLDYTMDVNSSQGYMIDVYGDCVVFNGTDHTKNTYYPAYSYMVDKSGEELVKNNIEYNEVTDTVSVTVDVSNLSKDTEFVYCYAYGDDEDSKIDYPGVAMKKNADGTYSAQVSKEYKYMTFIFNDAVLGRLASDQYPLDNCKVVIGADKIAYTPAASWGSTIYTYVWSDTNTMFEWPGIKMTKDSATGEYYAYVPKDTFTMVIFNTGQGSSNKTGDLEIAPYIKESIEGSYTVIEPETPTTTETKEPEVPTTQPQSEPIPTTTEEPVAKKVYGDADEDGCVTIKDASKIQKVAALIETISKTGFELADVDGDKAVTVKDTSLIQRYVAMMITEFPVEGVAEIVSVGADSSQLTALVSSVKATLAEDYRYASFDAYMALKKAYYQYKDADIAALSQNEKDEAYTLINAKLGDYNTMKSLNNIVTLYFSDNRSWGNAKAYIWDKNSNPLEPWDGCQMSYMETNSQNQKIYAITVNQSIYENIIFTNGSSQTIDLKTATENGTGYYLSDMSGGKYTVKNYVYGE